jgi:hypothetical protein
VTGRRTAPADRPPDSPGTDSRAAAHDPSRKPAFQAAPAKPQERLDVCAAVPLHQRPVVSYAEAAALGIAPERTLRRLVATGRVRRSVLRAGRRVRFVVRDLLDELRGAEG